MNTSTNHTEIAVLMRLPAYWNKAHTDSFEIRKRVTDWFQKKYQDKTLKADPEFFSDLINQGKTLFIGEGNLSFSLDLALRPNTSKAHIVATTYEDKDSISDAAAQNAEILKKVGANILHGIDAENLQDTLGSAKFSTIIFQFPHSGSRDAIRGKSPNFVLVRRFLKNAKEHLLPNSKVIITIVDRPHYHGTFQLGDAAKDAGFTISEPLSFDPSQFTGYDHTNTHDDESAINRHSRFLTCIFTPYPDRLKT